jgi:hypothetical protein
MDINKLDASLEKFFLAILRITIILALTITLGAALFFGVTSFKNTNPEEKLSVELIDDTRLKKSLNSFLVSDLKEEEAAAETKESIRPLSDYEKRFKLEVDAINTLFYNYYNQFKKSDFIIEAWTRENPSLAFETFFLEQIKKDEFATCVLTANCNLSNEHLDAYFSIISATKTIASTALENDGNIGIIKDQVKKGKSLYPVIYGNLIRNISVDYFKESAESLVSQMELYKRKVQARQAEIKELRDFALKALAGFFALAMLLLIVKIERNLRN